MNVSHQQIEQSTRKWVEDVIVGFNFCPFAKREVVRNTIRYCIVGREDEDNDKSSDTHAFFDALEQLALEFEYLDQHPDVETTLVIFSNLLANFDDFLDFLNFAEKTLIELGYEGIYQLAHFHPDYCFEGEAEDDPANYTNRSPYPTLHIIREASMEKVLANIAEPEAIPERNIEFARELGKTQLATILKNCMNHS